MRISWANVEQIVKKFARLHLAGALGEYAMRDKIYEEYRAGCNRTIRQDLVGAVKAAEGHWPAAATDALNPPPGNPDRLRLIQVHSLAQKNEWRSRLDGLQPGDRVISIVHHASKAPVVARLQIAVQANATGRILDDQLSPWLSAVSCVSEWKVMGPELGALGPDSAVIYLARPLSDGVVTGLVGQLLATLSNSLVDLNPAPLGLERVAQGIYGCSVPTEDLQRDELGMTRDLNGAGMIVASLLCKAASLAGDRAEVWAKDPRTMGGQEFDVYCRTMLEDVARRFGWTVV